MKALFVAATLVISSSAFATSFQTHEEFAIQEFNKSADVKLVKMAIERNISANTVGEAKAVLLRGQCGFAGCSRTYLVSQVIERNGTNATTNSISAIVNIPSIGETTVSSTVDAESLLNSLK